jgi:hypothetical protein
VYKKRVYKTHVWLQRRDDEPVEIRIARKHPDIQWNKVWTNLQAAPVTIEVKDIWYKAIHDILPTNNRLADTRIIDKDKCAVCAQRDTVIRRITTCGEGPVLWNRTRVMIGVYAANGPQRNPPSVDSTSRFPSMASTKTCDITMADSLTCALLPAGRKETVPQRLHEFPPQEQMATIPTH